MERSAPDARRSALAEKGFGTMCSTCCAGKPGDGPLTALPPFAAVAVLGALLAPRLPAVSGDKA